MVERQQRQPDRHLQHDRNAVQQQRGSGFLDGQHVEEAIDELRAMLLIECAEFDPRQSVGEVAGHAHEQSLLKKLHHDRLQRAQHARQRQAHKQSQAQDQ